MLPSGEPSRLIGTREEGPEATQRPTTKHTTDKQPTIDTSCREREREREREKHSKIKGASFIR